MSENLQLDKFLKQISIPALFYSLIIGLWLYPNFNTILSQFDGNQLGEASLKATDISARVSNVYLFIFSIIIAYAILTWLFKIIHSYFNSNQQRLENSILAVGSIQALVCLIEPNLTPLLIYPIVFHVGLWISLINRKRIEKEAFFSQVAFALISWQLITWFIPIVVYPAIHFTIILVIMFLGELIWRFTKFRDFGKFNNSIAIISLLPLFTIESNYLFREKLNNPISGFVSTLIILIPLLIFALLNYRRSKTILTKASSWLLIACGLSIQTFYYPYGLASSELFELANRATPLMEFHFFQNIPLLEKASSHLASDYGFGLIYQFIYGYHGLDFMIFDLIDTLGWVILSFILIYQITNNKLIAFYFVALFPFFDATLTPYYSWAFLPLIILIQAFNNPTKKWAWIFGITLALLFPWRADLSFAMIVSIFGIIGLGLYTDKIKLKFLFPTFISLGVLGITLLSISIIKNIDWINSLKSTIDYLQSSQSYGLTNIGDQLSNQFILHHIFIPICIGFILYFSIINIKNSLKSDYSASTITIIYLSVFYLVNLPRGIVRHGFAEGFDNFLDSYGPFIIILWCSITFIKSRKIQFWSALIAISIFQLFLRYPNRMPESTMAFASINKPINIKVIPFKHQSQRLKIDSLSLQNKIFPLVNFLRENLNEDETFIDFGNTPMLYFYAEKEVPAFFYQSPQNVHSITLQIDWLQRLGKYKTPIFLFRHHPSEWWDAADGVPNELRHYLIAEYAYKTYFPWQQVAGYEIWKTKSKNDTLLPKFMEPRLHEYVNLERLPSIWNISLSRFTEATPVKDSIQTINSLAGISEAYQIPNKKTNWLKLKINNNVNAEQQITITLLNLNNEFGGYEFILPKKSTSTYTIRLSILASWWLVDINKLRITIPDGATLEEVTFASDSN